MFNVHVVETGFDLSYFSNFQPAGRWDGRHQAVEDPKHIQGVSPFYHGDYYYYYYYSYYCYWYYALPISRSMEELLEHISR